MIALKPENVVDVLFGNRLRQLLDERNISQAHFADRIGVSRSRMNNYVAQRSEPDYATLIRIANTLDTSIDFLLGKSEHQGLPQTAYSALHDIRDAIGLRIVCCFLDDIYRNIEAIKTIPGVCVVEEKDYIQNVKPNGYRSYHMIIDIEAPYEDVEGNNPGHFFAEIQLRTIAMDSWASLEHQMKYKHDIKNPEMIVRELKRCADELAACDLSMQTIRNLIHADH